MSFIFIVALISLACDPLPRTTAEALFLYQPEGIAQYDLTKPASKYPLPYILEEVSGLSYVSPEIIACIQDEDGKIFFYNYVEKEQDHDFRFGKSGDYEGVEIVHDTAYVVKSNGTLYQFYIGKTPRPIEVKEIKTKLRKSNNVEGLTYDPVNNKLIIVCKNDAGMKGDKLKGRAAYSFDLVNKEMDKKPVFRITKKDIKQYLEKHKDFEYDENRINFNPSGIALHPISKLYYVISSIGKLMLIVDPNGEIKGSIPIDPRLLGQPEGICFAPNGDLFISSEGQGDKGYMLKFRMNP